jgi:glycosyltransferase involved in cell wall biosynthesis
MIEITIGGAEQERPDAMKILWVHNVPTNVESAGQWMFGLAAAVQQLGVQVDLHATGSLRGVARLAAARRQVTNLSKEYDLVHAQFGSACAVVASRAKCRRLVSLRGTDLLGCDTGSLWYRMHGRAARWMTGSSLRAYERVIVMSNRMRHELRRFHGRERGVEVVPDGIDLTRFVPRDRMESRRALGFADDTRPWVLFASFRSNNAVKRPQLAVAAYRRAVERRPDLVFKTISGRPHHELPLWMSAANVLLMTSTREGWPNVVKEALACNVPFVSTDVSDLAAIAAVRRSCTVTDATPDALADGILRAIAADSTDNLRSCVEMMSLPVIAERLQSIYASSLCGNMSTSTIA